ncbi:MAG: hypothetical protein ACYTGP_02695 [Planctomycetota bacterium]
MLDTAIDALFVLGTALPLALFWMAAAFGIGWPLRAWLAPGTSAPLCVQGVLGVAAMLVVDTVAARTGLLYVAAGAPAWALFAGGTLLLLEQARRHGGGDAMEKLPALSRMSWLTAAPLGVLVMAAASAPGWLWASEFGGYDVLSYHLQLPKEWETLGRAGGLEHNVYSFLPSYMECAFAHLFAVRHGAIDAAYAAQVLHACLAVFTAIVTGRAAALRAGPAIGAATAVLVLSTPWVLVVGSLAYNEMAVTLMLAGAFLLLWSDADAPPARLGLALGLMLGAAAGAKPTALVIVIAPVLLLLAVQRPKTLVTALAGIAVAIAPALVHNLVATGNPVFPFLTGLFGAGHWSAEQAAIWNAGHGADLGLADRLGAAWNQLFRYGFGPAPAPGEPWSPQWSCLPWLAVAAAVVGALDRARRVVALRLVAVLAIQVVLWIALTHVKSRFMVPAVVPAALLVAVAAESLRPRLPRAAAVVAVAALAALSFVPAVLLAGEKNGQPLAAVGATSVLTGEAHAARIRNPQLSETERADVIANSVPGLWVNYMLGPRARILCVGDATPFYYRRDDLVYQTTWDRGPVSAALAAAGDDDFALVEALMRDGFTHVLVDPTMLALWAEEGWNDPALTADRVVGALTRFATEVVRLPSGVRLYEL